MRLRRSFKRSVLCWLLRLLVRRLWICRPLAPFKKSLKFARSVAYFRPHARGGNGPATLRRDERAAGPTRPGGVPTGGRRGPIPVRGRAGRGPVRRGVCGALGLDVRLGQDVGVAAPEGRP